MTHVLETTRLILRKPAETDLTTLAPFYADERASFVGGPQNTEQTWRTMAGILGHWDMRGYGFMSVDLKDTGETIGMVGPWFPYGWPEPELGWMMFDGFEGKGYAAEAALGCREYAYGTLGWTTAISLIAPNNTRSIALATRLGATYETDFTHDRVGTVGIYRHPAKETVQ